MICLTGLRILFVIFFILYSFQGKSLFLVAITLFRMITLLEVVALEQFIGSLVKEDK